jgi:ribosomal protein S18 acetylase RimI-like enzyme
MSRLPYIMPYRPESYGAVRELLLGCNVRPPDSSEEIERGIGLMAGEWSESDPVGPTIAFVWALAAHGQPTAYIDYFGVAKGYRGTKAGYILLRALAAILQEKVGVKKLIASISPENRATLRMLRRHGALDMGAQHYVLMGLEEGAVKESVNGN